jgi:putative addiction module component (TIGR02574 family)
MTMTLDAVLKQAMTLSPKERAVLADELWRSVPHDDAEFELTPEQDRDLQRRIAEDNAGASDPQDWETIREKLRHRE